MSDISKLLFEQKNEIKQKLKQKNKKIFEQLDYIHEISNQNRNKIHEIIDPCEDKIFNEYQSKDIHNLLMLKDSEFNQKIKNCSKHPIVQKLRKQNKKIGNQLNKLEQQLYKNTVKQSFPIDDMKVTLSGIQYHNLDTDSIMTNISSEIQIGKRKYWHNNIFDVGDIIGKEGCKAQWYYNMNPEKMKEDKCNIDDIDIKNMKKIEDIFSIGIRM